MGHHHGTNWAGNIPIKPALFIQPESEAEVKDAIRKSIQEGCTVQVVGSRHTCSDLIRVDDQSTLLSLDKMQGIVNLDPHQQTVTVLAGTKLSTLNQLLWKQGFALENLGDTDAQALAGVISTSTHGSGSRIGSLSTQVVGLTLITADGTTLDCSAQHNPDIFKAAQVSLGSFGVIISITLKVLPSYRLHMITKRYRREEVLDRIEELLQSHRHVECWVWPHTPYVSLRTTDPTSAPITRTPLSHFIMHILLENGALWLVSSLCRLIPSLCNEISTVSAWFFQDNEVDRSYRILATPRLVKYLEMEYVVPAAKGPACLNEIMDMLKEQGYPVSFPIHYRYVAKDDIYLSPFYGRPSASIDVQQFIGMPYQNYFSESEKIFRKHEGRPHWGKLHSLRENELRPLYPKWHVFQDVRKQLDPEGVFLTPYLKQLFGP